MNKDVFNQFINHIEFSKFFKYLNIKKEKNPENIKKIKELNTVMNKLKKLQFDTLLEYLGICEAIPSDHMAKEYCMDFISKMAGLHEMLRAKLKNVTMAKDNNEADPKLSDVEKENFDKIIENTKPPKQENANFIHYIYNALRNASIGHVNDFENFWQKEHKD
ncbi:unnamed protein product [Meloidogyne enterolobii]|uniref:Uncharacterized protein n=1 Tax=Meloidogyne enterolobii TaxID=390850 RepID=A0ACB1A0N3_MELEN